MGEQRYDVDCDGEPRVVYGTNGADKPHKYMGEDPDAWRFDLDDGTSVVREGDEFVTTGKGQKRRCKIVR